jgi:molecular chaperone GrpE
VTEKKLNEDENIAGEEINSIEETLDINDFKELLDQKQDEITDLNNKLTRLQADFQNFKKRSDREKEQSVNYGIEKIVKDLLPILDNFQRAVKTYENTESSFYQGIEMIEMQLLELLSSNSILEVAATGEKFDPNIHHAVSVVESELDSETIAEVLQKGYKLNDKVIRPAMVIVSK